MPEHKSWGDVLKDPALIIALWVTTQFFLLILTFSFWPSRMDTEAKSVILQTYVIGFTASWSFFLGSSAGSKQKDAVLKGIVQEPAKEPPKEPPK